jgi:hypothetical protein
MRPRVETLKRVEALYGIVEEMHFAELQRMTASLREVQEAIDQQRRSASSARLDSRNALMREDRLGWEIADAQRAASGWKRLWLDNIRGEREALCDAARVRYVASQLKNEQMKRLIESIIARTEVERGRRMQAMSDDRFLTRKRWTDMQNRLRTDQR